MHPLLSSMVTPLVTTICKYQKYAVIIKGKKLSSTKETTFTFVIFVFLHSVILQLRTKVYMFTEFQKYFYQSIFNGKKWH